jgi:hypothetical protein
MMIMENKRLLEYYAIDEGWRAVLIVYNTATGTQGRVVYPSLRRLEQVLHRRDLHLTRVIRMISDMDY